MTGSVESRLERAGEVLAGLVMVLQGGHLCATDRVIGWTVFKALLAWYVDAKRGLCV